MSLGLRTVLSDRIKAGMGGKKSLRMSLADNSLPEANDRKQMLLDAFPRVIFKVTPAR